MRRFQLHFNATPMDEKTLHAAKRRERRNTNSPPGLQQNTTQTKGRTTVARGETATASPEMKTGAIRSLTTGRSPQRRLRLTSFCPRVAATVALLRLSATWWGV